jgi:hypothetical protein
LLICLLSGGLQAQKIKVEFDKDLDFSKFKTFARGPLDAVARPLLAASIQVAIDEQLTKKGLQKVGSNPDVFLETDPLIRI